MAETASYKESRDDECKEKVTTEEEIIVQPSKLNLKMLKLLSSKENNYKEASTSKKGLPLINTV